MFYNRLSELCLQKGVTPNRALVECNISRTAVAKWKKGAVPNGVNIQKLADYFGVTADYLLETNTETAPTEEAGSELPHEHLRELLAEGGMHLLMDADAKLPEEHVEEIIEFIKMKQRKYGR